MGVVRHDSYDKSDSSLRDHLPPGPGGQLPVPLKVRLGPPTVGGQQKGTSLPSAVERLKLHPSLSIYTSAALPFNLPVLLQRTSSSRPLG